MDLWSRCKVCAVVAGLCGLLTTQEAISEQAHTTVPSSTIVLIPDTLTGPLSMGPRGKRRFCNPRAIGLAEWRAASIARILRLDDLQKSAINELSEPSAKALEMIASACSKTNADKPQLELMEMKVEMMLQVLRTVRPAYEKFYAVLSDTQKKTLNALGPGRHGWQF